MTLTFLTLGTAGLLGLTGCGAGPAAAPETTPVAAEAAAEAIDAFELFEAAETTEAAETAGAAPAAAGDRGERRNSVRRYLRKNTLHGEVTVQGKDGVRTVVVQRGAVTAVDADSISVKSSDGFTLDWVLDDTVRVRQGKEKAEVSAVKVGATVGLAGGRDGSAVTVRLIVLS